MKKLLMISFLMTITVLFSSCTVNWFGKSVDAPWYYVLIPILLVLVFGYIILMSKTYICPHCKTEFKAKPYQLYVMIHFDGKRVAKCPSCKKKGLCEIKK